ncbi:hypothetical protein ET33_01330 [Paenibacillus tyrfis]|uniref:Uncharacterized protein n=1 Tax=Paenibacillus tyrfis TaxID=1501230 RepID=A0A081P3Y1_9BACL|nr:hypothetical protein ET33_01330 [Paenibacillus tyrfis]
MPSPHYVLELRSTAGGVPLARGLPGGLFSRERTLTNKPENGASLVEPGGALRLYDRTMHDKCRI